ncbi:biotin-dependent carboxyltransferase family protein [Salinicoccus cyprini]|uniref:Biotin-dependent carboxyltransferase family protein n=1 Tax=Salinicoccus cyprini TaxID=2493691 RepID=A0A558ATX9_9STAP|nr:biotin-dependent carboxyltransferase family protein [Salinicoccus cyprini]TVT27715.1 biotin-dependent carboxyltransferase family protein [Salinicoccus cyprini]
MTLKVTRPGLYTTVQDLGRFGHQSEGFSPAGAMDYRALMLANQLLGNEENAPGIEMTFKGATFEVVKDTVVATAGADMKMKIDDDHHPAGVPVHVAKGSTIEFGAAENGSRTYLVVPGGFKVETVLGSASTHVRSGIGGYKGRPFQVGDLLHAGAAGSATPYRIKDFDDGDGMVRVIPGQQFDRFDDDMKQQFFSASYALTKDCDRMGFRLDGPELVATPGHDVLSEPTQLGSIQVPKGGRPIVLLNDRQTAGGYARIGTVAHVDIPKLVQKQPGDMVKFIEITVEEASTLHRDEMERIRNGGYLEINNAFRSHGRPVARKVARIMKR